MGILAAVLSNAGRISLDVAGIALRPVERRGEQQCQAVIAADQLALDRRHRRLAALGTGDARDHAPGLGDRINPALIAGRRADRRAVVELAAPVPAAVPRLALERLPQAAACARHVRRARRFAACLRQRQQRRSARCAESQPSQTLSPLPLSPTRFMPSFQSPAADQRQAVSAERRGSRRGRARSARRAWRLSSETVGLEEAVVLALAPARAFEEGNHLIENARHRRSRRYSGRRQ